MSGLLFQRAVLLAKIESTYNTDPTPTASDAILAEEPEFMIEPNVLERNFARNDIGRLPHRIGRKLAKMRFMTELKGNGAHHDGTTASKIGRLMRACGMAETGYASAASATGSVNADSSNTGADITWSSITGLAVTQPVLVTFEVTTGGASGTAEMTVSADLSGLGVTDQAATAVTSGSAVTITGAAEATPTWTGNLVAGDKFYLWLYPVGYVYEPVSESFESLTLYLYLDGILHKMTGARGTFSLSGEAGDYPKMTFEFTGQYVDPEDAAMPSNPILESTLPPILENASLRINSYAAIVNQLSFDLGGEVVHRQDANSSDGYDGVRFVRRDPTGGIDPEMTLVATEAFHNRLKNATEMLLRARFGSTQGNQAWLIGPRVQYTGLTYQSRDNLRVLDAGLKFPRWFGDDEVALVLG